MCCHPALTRASAIALTLRAVGGLTTAEIAAAFLVPEATMAQRISRAKQRVQASGVRFELPTSAERRARIDVILQVLYLIFNEGYTTSSGPELQRTDLASEAIHLTRALHAMLPRDGDVAGLLALMLLTDARRAARTDSNGELIPLDEQDRSLWNRALIAEGVALVSEAMTHAAVGPYQLQAAIAALHDEAPTVDETDWREILALYEVLERMTGNPMVHLSLAVAAAMVHGPQQGLAMVEAIAVDERIAGHYRLDAVRAHLYERARDWHNAVKHFALAAEKTTSVRERNYLIRKAARVRTGAPDGGS
jgi:predicted RNA polymerase sigma factor